MQIEGSDALDYEKAIAKGMNIIENNNNKEFGLLVICGVNFGLRISDLLGISYDQLKSGEFVVCEEKTSKKRKIVVNSVVKEALDKMPNNIRREKGGKTFVSQKGTVYSQQHINRMLKEHFQEEGKKISTHSLRKAFGKRFYDKFGAASIPHIQMQFNHSSPDVTLRYIGVTQDVLDNMYEQLV